MCGGGDVLLRHDGAIYIVYGVGATLRIFNGTDGVVIVKCVGRYVICTCVVGS